MHKNHLVGCAAGIAIALAVVALSGGSAGSLGVLAIVLLCPIAMAGVMWLLLRPTPVAAPSAERREALEDAVR